MIFIAIAGTVWKFWPTSRAAAVLLLPYLAWTSYAFHSQLLHRSHELTRLREPRLVMNSYDAARIATSIAPASVKPTR
ncbi:tryptophan-rich sensory protein [Nesterenkonia natronophila]